MMSDSFDGLIRGTNISNVIIMNNYDNVKKAFTFLKKDAEIFTRLRKQVIAIVSSRLLINSELDGS